jgi:hypothetical protein
MVSLIRVPMEAFMFVPVLVVSRGVRTTLWLGALKEGDHWEDLGLDGG